jgi:hypothetical protein
MLRRIKGLGPESHPGGTEIFDVEKFRPFSAPPRSYARLAGATSAIAAEPGGGDRASRGDELERARARPPKLLLPFRRRGLPARAARVAQLGDLFGS